LRTEWWLPRLTLASERTMCSHHDAMQLEPPEGGSAPRATARRLWQLVSVVVRGSFPAPIDQCVPVFSGFLVLCRAEAENCGAWVRRSWHRTAPTSPTFLLYRRQTHPCQRDCLWRSGARLRQLPRLRCLEQIVCLGEGAAGAAPLRRRLGGRWTADDL